jgi:hypothetical protein
MPNFAPKSRKTQHANLPVFGSPPAVAKVTEQHRSRPCSTLAPRPAAGIVGVMASSPKKPRKDAAKANERRARILELLQSSPALSNRELARMLRSKEATVRQDRRIIEQLTPAEFELVQQGAPVDPILKSAARSEKRERNVLAAINLLFGCFASGGPGVLPVASAYQERVIDELRAEFARVSEADRSLIDARMRRPARRKIVNSVRSTRPQPPDPTNWAEDFGGAFQIHWYRRWIGGLLLQVCTDTAMIGEVLDRAWSRVPKDRIGRAAARRYDRHGNELVFSVQPPPKKRKRRSKTKIE